MTMTEKNLAEKLRAEANDGYTTGDSKWQGIARLAAELLGVDLASEPSGPGMYRTRVGDILIVGTAKTEYPDALWLCGEGGSGKVYMINAEDLRSGSYPLTRLVSVATTPVTLTEDQVGEFWDAHKSMHLLTWESLSGPCRASMTATVNAALAQHAAPAEEAT